ncbi:MAG: hypothetical protein LUE27_01590 [Clostridia bacterium]|nr:hypothetical protein [Clostridia bacterium]
MDITGIIELVIIVVLVLLIIGAFIWGRNHHKTDDESEEENLFTFVTVYVECTRDKINDNVQSYIDRGFFIAATYPEPRKVKKNEVTEFTLILKRYVEDIPDDEKEAYEEYKKTSGKKDKDSDSE